MKGANGRYGCRRNVVLVRIFKKERITLNADWILPSEKKNDENVV